MKADCLIAATPSYIQIIGWCLAMTLLFVPPPAFADSKLNGRTILIDPGHAVLGFHGNTINTGKWSADGTAEHWIAFQIAERLGRILKEEGARVVHTRTESDY